MAARRAAQPVRLTRKWISRPVPTPTSGTPTSSPDRQRRPGPRNASRPCGRAHHRQRQRQDGLRGGGPGARRQTRPGARTPCGTARRGPIHAHDSTLTGRLTRHARPQQRDRRHVRRTGRSARDRGRQPVSYPRLPQRRTGHRRPVHQHGGPAQQRPRPHPPARHRRGPGGEDQDHRRDRQAAPARGGRRAGAGRLERADAYRGPGPQTGQGPVREAEGRQRRRPQARRRGRPDSGAGGLRQEDRGYDQGAHRRPRRCRTTHHPEHRRGIRGPPGRLSAPHQGGKESSRSQAVSGAARRRWATWISS